jgi:hypothetical protein
MDEELFIQARDRFMASLPPHERALLPSCDSAEKLLMAVSEIKLMKRAVSFTMRRCLIDHIKSLVDALRPYFECIGLFVQANSAIAAPVWGAIRLVLQVSLKLSF